MIYRPSAFVVIKISLLEAVLSIVQSYSVEIKPLLKQMQNHQWFQVPFLILWYLGS